MSCTLHVAWDDQLAGYDFGPGHPMAPIRLKLTMELAQAFGLDRRDGVSIEVPAAATDAELELVHEPAYIAMVRLAGSLAHPAGDLPAGALLSRGLGTEDDPVFTGMHEAAAMIAGATLAAARAVWTSAAQHGASIAGGLHHAMAGHASGFCVYNDPAIAIAWLLSQGAERVAYVDVDAHHGDGVQAAFWDDPRVLTISLHEHPATLFPGTGLPAETGGPRAAGSAVNVALPAGTRDAGWLRAFHAVVPPLLREFSPQVLVSQHGCDTHWSDPLANLELTIDGQRAAHAAVHALAHEILRRPLAAHRRRRLPAPRGRAAELDAPALRGGGQPARPGITHPRPVARVRGLRDRPALAAADDRGRHGAVHRVRPRLRPVRTGGPRDHGHPEGELPAARADTMNATAPGRRGSARGSDPARGYRTPAAERGAPPGAVPSRPLLPGHTPRWLWTFGPNRRGRHVVG